jgi:hypothetical protein
MATTFGSLITDIRAHLIAPLTGDNADEFWTDAELLGILKRGVSDLWRAVNDNYQNYFLTVDATHVSIAVGTDLLSGVPADVAIIRAIKPRVPSAYPYLKFEFRNVDHKDFIAAETQGTIDSGQARLVFFYISQAGAPIAAPEVHIAPMLSAAVPLALVYVQTLGTFTASSVNPVPGESDQALISWGVAWARAKEREDRSPDPAMIQMYATEKQNILVSLTPRQTQDEEVAEALFEGFE